MEFLRLGSRIAGKYWGCCAVDVIQDFNTDPDEKMSIQLVHGDSGTAMTNEEGQPLYLGPTWRDIFNTRIRIGTFGTRDMPNHMFLATLTDGQLTYGNAAKWLLILRENGFQYLGSCDNSVYTGSHPDKSSKYYEGSGHRVHLFGLFRNIGRAAIPDPFAEPEPWTSLPKCEKTQRQLWDEGKTVLLTEADLLAAGAPVYKAGTQGTIPKNITAEAQKRAEELAAGKAPTNPFPHGDCDFGDDDYEDYDDDYEDYDDYAEDGEFEECQVVAAVADAASL